ncbi:uncharacterized protein LOC110275739 [Arachis duranensis]|uniref:Uncharacterized protein LOC110275739 n=1 Tax=Arachis duranensis TaxID=130453 RepID=A0A6P5MS63_ARADU|nr:uncharacterized protein LOC110275739 [Arachis duranensis]
MELLRNYDCSILYYPSKANAVANALNRKSICSLNHIALLRRPLVQEIHKLEFESVYFKVEGSGPLLAYIRSQSSLIEQIKSAQSDNPKLRKLMEDVHNGKNLDFSLDQDILRCGNRLCVPNNNDLKKAIIEEVHNSKYTIHPSTNKMYQDLKQLFWWEDMKKDVSTFVSHCLTCQQVKAEYQRPIWLLQHIEIPE